MASRLDLASRLHLDAPRSGLSALGLLYERSAERRVALPFLPFHPSLESIVVEDRERVEQQPQGGPSRAQKSVSSPTRKRRARRSHRPSSNPIRHRKLSSALPFPTNPITMASRFTQLLFLALLVLFLPTIFYLRPTSPSRIYSPSTGSWYGSAGSLPGSPSSGTTQGTGVMSNDDQSKGDSGWRWPDNLVEPAKLKAGDYWKSWRESWKTQGKGSAAGSSSSAAPALAAADGNSAFASKMGNETAKAELGRATWRFLHTMTLRFPDHPTPEQRTTLSTFFHSFALLYPCGECANHFQELLKELPPQTSSRMAASLWLCSAHNRVNKRLGKAEFPCDKLDET